MKSIVKRFLREETGQDLIEYALLVALLAVACIVGLLQLTGIKDFFDMVGRTLASAI